MSELLVVSGHECSKALQKAGFVIRRQTDNHFLLSKTSHTLVVIPTCGSLDKDTLRAIINRADLSIDDFNALTESQKLNLADLKRIVRDIEPELPHHPFVIAHIFDRNGRHLHLGITERLQQKCRKGKVWNSKPFLTALKNAEYGFDEQMARSVGGRDGIFLLDRDFRPRHPMQHKLFDHYLDKPDSGVTSIAQALHTSVAALQAVRLVSHHLRLLGVLWRGNDADWLILVDYDDS